MSDRPVRTVEVPLGDGNDEAIRVQIREVDETLVRVDRWGRPGLLRGLSGWKDAAAAGGGAAGWTCSGSTRRCGDATCATSSAVT
ncbi:hypothetical protein OQI_29530 [Streptomyces pharetrae CZA14]|uniref:Uncharacterized protein n=1 Tax=Streptomyces pharetrae CZA14 TaxID=1144883 RepID=A0ABX3YCA9_9ACTN|nr:hypothetical protein OQI_29530 [Streptomyces pharetrae CZA14]